MAAFAALVGKDQLGRTVREFEQVIAASFVSHPMRGGLMPRTEVTRRFELCTKIFVQLRGDAKWGLEKIFDKLPIYLGCELDGVDWKPDNRTIWTPE